MWFRGVRFYNQLVCQLPVRSELACLFHLTKDPFYLGLDLFLGQLPLHAFFPGWRRFRG